MTTYRFLRALILLSLLGSSPLVVADSLCTDKDTQTSRAKFKQAEDLEKAGKLEDAFAMANSNTLECFDNSAKLREFETRVTRTLGKKAEDKGDLVKAYEWYTRIPEANAEHADRVMRNAVKAKPMDKKVFSNAYSHFNQRQSKADLSALKEHAINNGNEELKQEAASYAKVSASYMNSAQPIQESFSHMALARDWFYYAPEKTSLVASRAEQRGDSTAANDGREWLRTAISYYDSAEKPQKSQAVRDKARRLAEQSAKQGDTRVAVEYYQIAGDDQQAERLEKNSEAVHEKAEEKRKQEFNKDADDLDKKLGL